VTRFLVLFLFLIWMAWRSSEARAVPVNLWPQLTLFFGFYLFLIAVLGLWSRLLAKRMRGPKLRRQIRYFDAVIFSARLAILGWFGIGVFFLNWGDVTLRLTASLNQLPVQLPQALVGTLPCMAAWMALWWSQYPAERALREQNMMVHFDEDLPLRRPPSFADFFVLNLRLQILFTAVPFSLILLIHDLAATALWWGGVPISDSLEGAVMLCSALIVFVCAPMIIRHVLHTQSLPDSPLRRRLEEFCREHNLKYRDILIWQTNHNLGNAAVMGIIPQVRYILMSDLLLERMSPEQIEAVFAHEVGHIVHRHMIWFLVFFKGVMLALTAAALLIESYLKFVHVPGWVPMDLVIPLTGAGSFLLAFGFISRRFERQADVFAARHLERRATKQLELASAEESRPHVGPYGARIFASALQKVAIINGMPITGGLWRNWSHGSIDTRMRYLHKISEDPAHTQKFDRFMSHLYAALLISLILTGGIWLAVEFTGALRSAS
jgi:STE24 endopeptidase